MATNAVISRVLKEDIIKGAVPYIRKGQVRGDRVRARLYFDAIQVTIKGVSLMHKGKLLVTYPFGDILDNKDNTITFELAEMGSQQIYIT